MSLPCIQSCSTDDDKDTGSELENNLVVEGDSSEPDQVGDSSLYKLKSKGPNTKGKKSYFHEEANVCNAGSDLRDSSLGLET